LGSSLRLVVFLLLLIRSWVPFLFPGFSWPTGPRKKRNPTCGCRNLVSRKRRVIPAEGDITSVVQKTKEGENIMMSPAGGSTKNNSG
jgi:hypothetical protein